MQKRTRFEGARRMNYGETGATPLMNTSLDKAIGLTKGLGKRDIGLRS